MKWWPLFGLKKQWTEKKQYPTDSEVTPIHRSWFRRSLFIYVIDVGSSNGLNYEITALESPQYNIHRLGIFFTDSPRHADILLVLGRPTPAMLDPLQETISQLPEPFGIITIDDHPADLPLPDYPELPRQIAHLQGVPEASEILGIFLNAAKRKTG
jgi:hypothetical protein